MTTTIGSFDLASLKNLRDDVTQYFWFESDSSSAWGSGAHVTLYPESQFTDSTSQNYMKGQNIIMNTDGFSIRNGGLPMMVLDNDSLDFNAIDTTQSTYTTIATFGLTGATIGRMSGAHSVIDADGQRFYASNGTTQLANIGYGEGQAQSGTTVAPYYTFGTRKANTTIGNWSFAEGYVVTASGSRSHAEGQNTTASGTWSHAEGQSTIASGDDSHAEGNNTTASGSEAHAEGANSVASGGCAHAEGTDCVASGTASHAEGAGTIASKWSSHAEGSDTIASGDFSHVQNYHTVATSSYQTVIGKYNKATRTGSGTKSDPYVYSNTGNYAFVIGNGDDDDTASRSNALTVDWDGNINMNAYIDSDEVQDVDVWRTIGARDSNNVLYAAFATSARMYGQNTAGIYAYKTVSGTRKVNALCVGVEQNGDLYYTMSSPSAFRTALNLGGAATRPAPSISSVNATHSISANSYYEFEITVSAVSGKFPNIRGFNITGTNSSLIHVMGCFLSGGGTTADPYKAHLKCRNMHTAAVSATGYVYILWV